MNVVYVLLPWLLAAPPTAMQAAPWPTQQQPSPSLGPATQQRQQERRWREGDQWVVQTQSMQVQANRSLDHNSPRPTVEWRFVVLPSEPIRGRRCRHVRAICSRGGSQQQETHLWVDYETDALMRVQSQLPTASGSRTVVQDFQHTQGRPAAVLGPLSALPIDWPVRSIAESSKSTGNAYTVLSTSHLKHRGLSIAKRVKQTISPLSEQQTKALGNLPAIAGDVTSQAKEIILAAKSQRVRQVWRSGLPWPLLSDNGHTRAELVSFDPAPASDGEEK